MKRTKSKPRKTRKVNGEKLEKGVVHEIIQPMKVFVWICPRPGCIHSTFAERFQATVEAFLMVQVGRHVEMHEREDNTEKRMNDIASKAQVFR